MQLVKTERDTLLRPLQTVAGIVERRNTLPILANVVIKKEADALSFLSTDLEIQITTSTECPDGAGTGAVTVAARKLLDILRALPSDSVSLSLADSNLIVQSGKSRFKLQTLPASDFPTLTVAEDFGATVTIPQKTFRQLLLDVHFAMAQQDIRYYLNGMLLVVEGGKLTAVATDGHRLACSSVAVEGSFPKQEVILTRKTVLELQRLLDDSDDPLEVSLASSQIRFSFSSVVLISKLLEGKFPDYTRVIPKGYKNQFVIGRESLQRSLQRAAILTTDKFKGVRWEVRPGLLQIRASNAEHEETNEELEIAYDGDTLDIGFNVTYVLDVLSNTKSDMLSLAFGDSNSSALLTIPDKDNFKYVVMPMRI